MNTADIRQWLRDQGDEVNDRGPLPRGARERYADAHPEEEPAYPEGMTDADFPGDYDVSDAGPPPADEVKESKPRKVATTSAPARFQAWRRGTDGKKKPRAKSKKPRVPVDDVVAGIWRGLAGFAKPLPATSKLLKIQAPVAGVILEDTVKGTVVDTVLQPLARTSKSAEAVAVLLGPPILVGVIEMQSMQDPDSPVIPLLLPPLRELMLRWCKIAGPKMTEAMAREREFEEEFGQNVDEMLAFLFMAPGGSAADEEAAVRAAQERMQAAAA